MGGGSQVLIPKDLPSSMDTKGKTEFRNYEENGPYNDRVSRFYWQNRKYQTFEEVQKKKREILNLNKCTMSVWDAAEMLNELVDQSDPDTESAQIVHLLQTAEAIRREFPGEEYDWFHLTGFIHDLGKVLAHPTMYNEPQWAVVGDTFPVGCKFAESNVFHQFFEQNPDFHDPRFNTELGVYREEIGLDNVEFSFGHDEYLYQVCVQNGSTLPTEALYIIRYHSFYPWHTFGSYTHLTNEKDRDMLKWVKQFQKFDLYSKLPEKPDLAVLVPYYKGLIAKYFPTEKLRW